MNKKKIGALVAAIVAAITAFWYTYSSEVEKVDDTAPVAPVESPAPVEPVAAPENVPADALVVPAEPVEVK